MKTHKTSRAREGQDVTGSAGASVEGPSSDQVGESTHPPAVNEPSNSSNRRSTLNRPRTSHPPLDLQSNAAAPDLDRSHNRAKTLFLRCKTVIKSLLPSRQRRNQSLPRRRSQQNSRSQSDQISLRSWSPSLPSRSQDDVSLPPSPATTRMCKDKRSIWKQDGRVAIVSDDEIERKRSAIVLFDSQCAKNLLSTDFLEKVFSLTFDESNGEPLGYSVNGSEPIMSIGRKYIRWWAPNLMRYEYALCHIVKSDRFDLIIGEETMTALGIFELRRTIIAPFMSLRPGLTGLTAVDVSEGQRQATARREQERIDREREEAEKKRKLQAANTQTS